MNHIQTSLKKKLLNSLFLRFFIASAYTPLNLGTFWHQGRTHSHSTIEIRKLEVYGDQKNTTDLMFEHGPTTPHPHTGLICFMIPSTVLSSLHKMLLIVFFKLPHLVHVTLDSDTKHFYCVDYLTDLLSFYYRNLQFMLL